MEKTQPAAGMVLIINGEKKLQYLNPNPPRSPPPASAAKTNRPRPYANPKPPVIHREIAIHHASELLPRLTKWSRKAINRVFEILDVDGSDSLSASEIQDLDYALKRRWEGLRNGTICGRIRCQLGGPEYAFYEGGREIDKESFSLLIADLLLASFELLCQHELGERWVNSEELSYVTQAFEMDHEASMSALNTEHKRERPSGEISLCLDEPSFSNWILTECFASSIISSSKKHVMRDLTRLITAAASPSHRKRAKSAKSSRGLTTAQTERRMSSYIERAPRDSAYTDRSTKGKKHWVKCTTDGYGIRVDGGRR